MICTACCQQGSTTLPWNFLCNCLCYNSFAVTTLEWFALHSQESWFLLLHTTLEGLRCMLSTRVVPMLHGTQEGYMTTYEAICRAILSTRVAPMLHGTQEGYMTTYEAICRAILSTRIVPMLHGTQEGYMTTYEAICRAIATLESPKTGLFEHDQHICSGLEQQQQPQPLQQLEGGANCSGLADGFSLKAQQYGHALTAQLLAPLQLMAAHQVRHCPHSEA